MTADSHRSRRPSYEPRDLGPLPVRRINAALGTELEAGDVRLSATAHRHIAEDHPDDYPDCIANLNRAITAPTFVGQAPHQKRNFEIIKRIARPDGRAVLVAIGLEPDASGSYRVRSCYLISREGVDERRIAGRLRPMPPE